MSKKVLSFEEKKARILKRYDKIKHMTAEQLRVFLLKRECYGSPRQGDSCPLATYLNDDCRVGRTYVEMGEARVFIASNSLEMRNFIAGFDAGNYPELDIDKANIA